MSLLCQKEWSLPSLRQFQDNALVGIANIRAAAIESFHTSTQV
jgi:hypothetical protein